MSQASLKILRYSLFFLFVWFGYQQLVYPESWIGFLPDWTGYLPIPAAMLVQLNGWMEIMFSFLLLFGVFTRVAVTIVSTHLFFIALWVGGAVGVRDAVLALAGFALAASKADDWTVDTKYWSKK